MRLLICAAMIAAGACSARTAPNDISPLGHRWELRRDSLHVADAPIYGPELGGPGSSDGSYAWCDLHGGHMPRTPDEAIDANAWITARH